MTHLSAPSKDFTVYHEIAILPAQNIHSYYNQLSLEEKIFIYYLIRASAIGNKIASDQLHRDAQEIIDLCELIIKNEILFQEKPEFIDQVKTYLVYLWTSHSQYFNREDQQNKRTPNKLDLSHVTPQSLAEALEKIGIADAQSIITRLEKSIFDASYEPTLCVPDSIESSACNMYAQNFTEVDYQKLDPQARSQINSRCSFLENGLPRVEKYSAHERCAPELSIAIHWLKKASLYAEKHPLFFDEHVTKSLQFLIIFLETGNEEWFRKHSIEWLKTRSRVDYTFGFIESYDDPKAIRGMFAAEVSIKTININQLSLILPTIENELPFLDAYKRDTFDIPNASINVQVFGSGDYGPMKAVLAYCLPNYEDIRSQHGSKQIIYHEESNFGSLLHPELHAQLSYSNKQLNWIQTHDPKLEAINAAETLLTILHETIGHASGKLSMHTFVDGDVLTIENVTHTVGATIAVTNTNLKEFLHGYDQTIEELRAEIIALYVAVTHIDTIIATSIVPQLENITKEILQEWFIILMSTTAYRRLLRQPDDATIIAGDHARANSTITNYFLARGAIKEIREEKTINGIPYSVPSLHVENLEYAVQCIKDLMIQVQTIKSTGNGQDAHTLIQTYGTKISDPMLPKILRYNKQAVMGNIKAMATLYPSLQPFKNDKGDIIDIIATWPYDIFQMQHTINQMLSPKS